MDKGGAVSVKNDFKLKGVSFNGWENIPWSRSAVLFNGRQFRITEQIERDF